MKFHVHLSPRVILLGGVAGAILMAGAGYQLGRPSEPLAISLPAEPQDEHKSKVNARESAVVAVFSPGDLNTPQTQQEPAARLERPSDAPLISRKGNGTGSEGHQAKGGIWEKAVARGKPVHPLSVTPTWPLVLRAVDYEAMGLPPQQQAAIQKLQEQFVKEVGGPDQNPADPDYAQRWLTATRRADDLLRSQIGWEAFNAHSRAAMQGSTAQQ